MATLWLISLWWSLRLAAAAVQLPPVGHAMPGVPLASALPCPNAADILPCVCIVAHDHVTIDIDCSEVQDEYQLADVFKAHMPFTTFRKLTIRNNKSLERIRQGDLGQATFTEIIITNGVLVEIESNFLDGMNYYNLTTLFLYGNKLNTFPFQDIQSFYALDLFDIGNNNIAEIPDLIAYSLGFFYFYDNPLKEVTASTFKRLQNVELVQIDGSEIQNIEPGTFADMPTLRTLGLSHMKLDSLTEGAITLITDSDTFIMLNNNNISTIEPGAIKGTNRGRIYLSNNQLTDLDETVFRPFFDTGSEVFLTGNPLSCGCDLAWLITNPVYMKQLAYDDYDGPPTCSDGEKVEDLDPNIYLTLC